MITHVRIQNFRSFLDAEIDLQPFSLIVGANGSGKSNLLKFFASASAPHPRNIVANWTIHQNGQPDKVGFEIRRADNSIVRGNRMPDGHVVVEPYNWAGLACPLFNLSPDKISAVEVSVANAQVAGDGSGTAQVLDALKTGDREDLFDRIEENLKRYVPEVEKLSLHTVENGKKQIQVREKGLRGPLPATELSEGTRLIIGILTILHQVRPPAMILLEDIDRGMHPRLFEYVAPLMRDIAERNKINIIATTHNPYLVDCFQDHKDTVIIVEKKDGASTLTTLTKKLEGLDYGEVDPEDMPLGQLWYSGLIGGTPKKLSAEIKH